MPTRCSCQPQRSLRDHSQTASAHGFTSYSHFYIYIYIYMFLAGVCYIKFMVLHISYIYNTYIHYIYNCIHIYIRQPSLITCQCWSRVLELNGNYYIRKFLMGKFSYINIQFKPLGCGNSILGNTIFKLLTHHSVNALLTYILVNI